MTSLLVAALVAQCSYVRSRTDDTKATSQCLWWHENTELVYHQGADGNPETPGTTEFTAVSNAWATWQTEMDSCGSLKLTEGVRTSSRIIGYDEKATTNENIVIFRQRLCTAAAPTGDPCWRDESCGNAYDCWQHSLGAIAITTTSYHPVTGKILDSDIELNTPKYIFSTVETPVCSPPTIPYSVTCVSTDVQNTITHEVGHVLGLGHISVATSTMSPRADPGELSKRVLDCGSQKYICDAYPKGKPARGCVVLTADPSLGKAKTGCVAAPGPAFTALCLLLILARPRRPTGR